MEEVELDYKAYENQYGEMYHLLLDRWDAFECVKFVADKDHPKFAAYHNLPIFFDKDQNFRIAVKYTIVYPKVYVEDSVMLKREYLPLDRSYIH